MDIIFFPIHWISLLVILTIIATLAVFILKKWMMTYAILITNFIVFFFTLIFPSIIIGSSQSTGLGFRPMYLSLNFFPNIYTLFTSMFIHSGFLHIIGNMLVFFFMGVAFEQRIGWKKFLFIYLATGVCGALAHSALDLSSPIPLVGASGAIFGILGAFAFSYPQDEVVMPIPVGIMIITRIKVIYAAIIFAVMETIIIAIGAASNTSHFAHLGGLVGGILIAALLIKRKKYGDFNKQQSSTYYDSYAQPKTKKINFLNLESLAKAPEQQDMLKRVEQETVPQVQDIWLEHFIEKTVCPQCGKPLYHLDRRIWCESCGFRTTF